MVYKIFVTTLPNPSKNEVGSTGEGNTFVGNTAADKSIDTQLALGVSIPAGHIRPDIAAGTAEPTDGRHTRRHAATPYPWAEVPVGCIQVPQAAGYILAGLPRMAGHKSHSQEYLLPDQMPKHTKR